ncbi:hypothetical protein ACVIW2_009209 [Bradyrhizobium huanghuaihaiense]|jgi:hypothetical protein|nr:MULTISPECIES: hypothetical protein [Bradyrhizobium]BAP82108.1 peptide synthetase [Bradyrhizobium diazoefficiens]MBR1034602.1 hypothetical protein [Bradyrhizobium liaoningense]MCD9825740.1 hypothetical protein [Bradyrhizobium japonicum]MCW2319450.1 hypothetical protein [Bradyrhizobium japonicum]UQE03739.1 hypothetical protein JEY30_50100 [Bradyrhizobium japonicum]
MGASAGILMPVDGAPEQIDRMTQHLQILLRGVMADARQSVGRIDILPATDRTYLL